MDEKAGLLQAVIDETAAKLAAHPEVCTDTPALFRQRVLKMMELLRHAMFPCVFGTPEEGEPRDCLTRAASLLRELAEDLHLNMDGEALAEAYLARIPAVAETLLTDVEAAYEGDPAARSRTEVMLTYPAFEAISIYRLAHELYDLGVPMIPRIMTESAHRHTGIDIHPGAKIGPQFFIDHGTGVVIGETCTIGRHVKLYQGVTLGAKSFELDENGNPVKGIKRHPDIGNDVVIYSGATILGGGTVIGDGCVIGGNVWLTRSLPAGETVVYEAPAPQNLPR